MNIFTVLAALIIHLWLPLSIVAAVIAVAVLLAWAAVRRPKGTLPKRLALQRLHSGPGPLTADPVARAPFNDARDVWPMPPDD